MTDNGRKTMSISELAVCLGISRNLCYSLASQDRLPVKVIHVGRRMVVSRLAVEKLLSEDTDEQKEGEPDAS